MEKALGFIGIFLFLLVTAWQGILRFRALKLGYKTVRRVGAKIKGR